MKYILLLIFLVPTGTCLGQGKSSSKADARIQECLDEYHQEVQRLHDSYMESLLAARTEAQTKLEQLSEEFANEKMTAEVAKVREAREKLEARTAVANRLALRKDIVGKRYLWRKGENTIWRFLADGTIRSSTTQANIQWVALNDYEVLVLLANGSLRILQFNDDRSTWALKYLPPAKPGERQGARRVGEDGRPDK